jgi:hypothetical protein
MLAEEERDGRRRHQARRRALLAGHGGETRPPCFSRQADHVEHRRLVSIEPRGKHRPLPRAGRELVAVEDRHDLPQAVESRQPGRRLDVLPAEKEAHEIGRTDRLDVRAQPVQRVAMNAGEQRPVAPFEPGLPGRETSAQYHSVRLEQEQRRLDVRDRQAKGSSHRGGGDRPRQRQAASEDFRYRVAARP